MKEIHRRDPDQTQNSDVLAMVAIRTQAMIRASIHIEDVHVKWEDCVWCGAEPKQGGQIPTLLKNGMVVPKCSVCAVDPLMTEEDVDWQRVARYYETKTMGFKHEVDRLHGEISSD